MAAPTWAKLPTVIQDLLDNAPDYSLFQAMAAAEQAWGGAIGDGLDSWVRVEPNPSLAFPPADLRRGTMDERGVLHLRANVHGLYGVDAPVPHYLLEAAATDEEPGPRIRQFLDTFNHRLYSLLYQAWRVQNGVDNARDNAYTALAQALAGGARDTRLAHAGGMTRNGASPALLSAALTAELELPVEVVDGIPQWLQLPEPPALGAQEPPRLGDNAQLGEHIRVAGERIDIRIGPVDLAQAMTLLPGAEAGARVIDLVPKLAGVATTFDLVIIIRPEGEHELALGHDDLPLGWQTWLGACPSETHTVRITAGRHGPEH